MRNALLEKIHCAEMRLQKPRRGAILFYDPNFTWEVFMPLFIARELGTHNDFIKIESSAQPKREDSHILALPVHFRLFFTNDFTNV